MSGIATKLGNHSFRATGITAYLGNGGALEVRAHRQSHSGRWWPNGRRRKDAQGATP
jgi:hypothetical protein